MKKYILYTLLTVASEILYSQSINFIKQITNNNLANSCSSIKQDYNGNYFLLKGVLDTETTTVTNKSILKLDKNGNKKDSLSLDTILNRDNFVLTYIEKKGNNFLFWTTLSDSTYNYLYIKIIDTVLNTLEEKIIDTIPSNEFLCWHIYTSSLHHIFLTITEEGTWWRYYLYETDDDFNLIRKINPDFRDGFYVSISEIPIDSSYLITSRNWILKTNNNFNNFDTIVNRWQTELVETYNYTKSFSDSTYLESSTCVVSGSPELFPHPGFFVRTSNAVIIDTIAIPVNYSDNRLTQLPDFIDYISPDTIFYCAIADYKDWEYAENSQFFIAKLDLKGNIFWQRFFGGNGNYRNGSITATSDGGCIVQWNYWNWQYYPGDWRISNIILIKTDKYGNAPVGIDENSLVNEKQVLVYPNPAGDFINFETGFYNDLKLEIYNSTGQLLMVKNLKQGKNQISISNLPGGACFYRILYGNIKLENGTFLKL